MANFRINGNVVSPIHRFSPLSHRFDTSARMELFHVQFPPVVAPRQASDATTRQLLDCMARVARLDSLAWRVCAPVAVEVSGKIARSRSKPSCGTDMYPCAKKCAFNDALEGCFSSALHWAGLGMTTVNSWWLGSRRVAKLSASATAMLIHRAWRETSIAHRAAVQLAGRSSLRELSEPGNRSAQGPSTARRVSASAVAESHGSWSSDPLGKPCFCFVD